MFCIENFTLYTVKYFHQHHKNVNFYLFLNSRAIIFIFKLLSLATSNMTAILTTIIIVNNNLFLSNYGLNKNQKNLQIQKQTKNKQKRKIN